MALDALPTLNLPQKSHETPKPDTRREIIRTIIEPVSSNPESVYKNFRELSRRVGKLRLPEWRLDAAEELLQLVSVDANMIVPKFKVVIDTELVVKCFVFGWKLRSDNQVLLDNLLETTTVSDILAAIQNQFICPGVPITARKPDLLAHTVPFNTSDENIPYRSEIYYRTNDCFVLSYESGLCTPCRRYVTDCEREQRKKEKIANIPAKRNAPLTRTNPNRIALTVLEQRKDIRELEKKNKVLERTIERMQGEISSKSIEVDSSLSDDIVKIMEDEANQSDVTPFMKLFWEQSRENATRSKQARRYHPMIIRFCLSLASKSASAYDELAGSRILTLPSRKTLREYKNAIRPSPGFNPEVMEELCKVTEPLEGYQRFVCLSFDEMKIRENLVFDRYTDELIGFVDLGDPQKNYADFGDGEVIAKYACIFYVRGIASSLKFSLAYFATTGILSHQIMSLFWEGVSYLEFCCNLRTVACVSDGASPNRTFYKMHKIPGSTGVTHKAKNPYVKDCYIYFFADAPHLMKTARNCIYHSGFNEKSSRLMWNDGKYIIWGHIFRLAQDELHREIKLAPRISMNHVNLDPYSKMNVKLATQVLSQTVSNVLFNYYPDETFGTAGFIGKMNKFFDCLNVRSLIEHIAQRNPDKAPYQSHDDPRFEWLENDFLKYLQDWSESVNNRKGEFTVKPAHVLALRGDGAAAGRRRAPGKRRAGGEESDHP